MPTTYLQHRVSISNYAHFSKSKIPTKISSKLKPSNKFSEFSIKSVRNVIFLILYLHIKITEYLILVRTTMINLVHRYLLTE